LTLLVDALSGANLIHDLGYLESGITGSLELLALCDEIIGWIRRFMEGVETTDEALALDVIDAVGPDNHFLNTDHTLRHFREDWYPELMDRRNYDEWMGVGRKSLNERLKEKVEEILKDDRPQVLSKEIQKKVKAVRERAEARIKK
jgi:trimethylamine--corrinoid protein Co-methyltransferase